MLTKQTYYDNQYKKEVSTKILSISLEGNLAKVILEQTIFYPEGGGQPADQGIITGKNGKFEVQQVLIKEGEIIHIGKLTGELIVGEVVDTQIDWDRRYKNMRVHTAGHIINDATMQLFPELTPIEGEHGKKPFVKYHGNLDEISANLINERANKIIEDKLDIITEFVSLDELKKRATWVPEHLPKNKPLRIMQIGKFSVIPDGGTQLKNTSEVGQISEVQIVNESDTVYVYYKINLESSKIIQKTERKNSTFRVENSITSEEFINLKNQAIARIGMAHSAQELEEIRIDLFGKNGSLTSLMKNIKNADTSQKKQIGLTINEVKSTIEEMLNSQKNSFKENLNVWFDPTIPVKNIKVGHLHPTSIVINEMVEIFKNLGFSQMEGPEIESDHYNFELLNLPKDHPARSLQDVLYIEEPEILLRSHTSSVETRVLEKLTPPFRVVVAGKCYRFENVNASNNAMFYQFQGVALQQGLSMADLKGTLYHFAKTYFGEDRKIRFRCKYYPEVEPGVGLDLDCKFCNGAGCSVCKGRGWIEMLGAGMIHPKILQNFKIDPREISGFAFGMGLDRIVMDRFGITDIRSLYNGDIKY